MLAFSDLQADIAAELIRRGYSVFTFNQRSVAEILQMIRVVGGMVGARGRGATRSPRRSRRDSTDSRRELRLCHGARACSSKSGTTRSSPASAGSTSWWRLPAASRLSRSCANAPLAKDRIVEPTQSAPRDPEVIIASLVRQGDEEADDRGARRDGATWPPCEPATIYEIKSTYILQPGPASLTEGVARLHEHIARAVAVSR